MPAIRKINKYAYLALALIGFAMAQVLPAQEPAAPPPRGPEMEGPANIEIYASHVLAQADQLIQAKEQNGALVLLNENFDRFSRLRLLLLGKMIEARLAQDNIQAARELYLAYARQDKELARSGAELIYAYYLNKQSPTAALAWTGQLLELPLPADLPPAVYTWRLQAACAGGVSDQARAVIKDSIARFSPEVGRTIFAPTLAAFIAGKKYDEANRLLDMIARDGKGQAELRSLAASEKARIIFLQQRWPEGETVFKKTAADLRDGDLAGLTAFIVAQARNKEEYAAAERLSMFVLTNIKDHPRARNEAAAGALGMLKAAGQVAEIPARLEQLMALGVPADNLFRRYCDYFYLIIMKENPELTGRMLAFGAQLGEKIERPDDKKQVALLRMDGAFVAGDYSQALQIMAANKKYWDQEWLDLTRVKMQAHLELKNKNYQAAVENFRQYMVYVAKKNQTTLNPVTGQIYTAEMLLGFNALRIGNILRENLKDEAGARQAYDEAEQYFKKALPDVKPNSAESKYIEENMAQIAAQKKK